MNKTISPKITALTFGVLVISFLAVFYAVAWQEPTQAPPEGNVPNPLNVGNVGQEKVGGLILNTGGAEYGLIVDKGIAEFGESVIFGPNNRPTSPKEGQIYFDQGDKKMYYYNGVEWIELAVTAPLECGVCMIWSSEAGECVPLPAGTKDENCSATHYACNGAGNCTNPKTYQWTTCQDTSKTGTQFCLSSGFDGCIDPHCWTCEITDEYCYKTCSDPCFRWSSEGTWNAPSCVQCWSWVYD
ncbi:MAG: hypothetical protein COT59_00865 [Candidatus Nealsonbacteria bacterium CG09_land_8_20_14_0_10_42_14]|uniref:Uncharacterized protein n=1 Tax=Candidatus Nealsonbacteria bacterium CG09_land_8_20_14_0_10_42_14 TaxID=1974707 RepID=A0A2H0WZQ0_9BACT|nr:MAG: hypothetical protein COT59_00865 [Candidatus Nealsonbacteria bacterium CG09_land_8_20_14_0_10_42_14]